MLSLLPRRGGRDAAPAAPIPTRSESPESPLRSYLVQQILHVSPTAGVEFLARFDEESLREYLDHLSATAGQRGRQSRWIRPEGSSGIVWATARV